MDHRSTTSSRRAARRRRSAHHRPPTAVRRPGLFLGAAVAGAVVVGVVVGTDPARQADAQAAQPVSVAEELGLSARSGPIDVAEDLQPLEELAVSRSSREDALSAAQQAQAAADRAELDRRAAEAAAAEKAAAEKAAAEKAAAEKAAAEKAAAEKAAAEKAAADKAAAPARRPAAASGAASAPAASAAVSSGVVARINNSAGNVKPRAQAAANAVVSNVPGAAAITIGGTRASAADPKGHPSGLALDYMVLSDTALGEAIVQFQIANWDELGVEYIIYRKRMLSSPTGAWKQMEDRGSATANHMDHPHVNYRG